MPPKRRRKLATLARVCQWNTRRYDNMSATVYDIITDRIIGSLKQNVVPWRVPWVSRPPMNLLSKKPYRGVNVFLLSASRFTSPYWVTYRQAQAKGGQVRKGEKSTPVIFWKVFDNQKE